MPVDGAPVLGPNPYVGAAASAASGAISLMNSLQAAHDQQLRLDAQKRQQDAARRLQETNDYNKYLNEGAIALDPVDDPPQATNGQPGRPTILSGQSKASAHDPNRVAEFPTIGKRLYIPTTGEKEDAKQQSEQRYKGNATAPLNDDLAKEYQANGFDMKPGQSYAPGILGEANAVTREHNAQKNRKPKVSIDTENFKDASGNPAVVRINEDEGTYRILKPEDAPPSTGVRADLNQAAGLDLFNTSGVHGQAAASGSPQFTGKPTKEAQPKSLHFEKDTNDSGDVTTAGYDPEKGTRVSSETRKGIGPKRKDPDAVTTKPGQAKPQQFRSVEKDKANAITKARQQWRKDLSEAITDDDRKSANDNYRTSVQDAQNNYEAGLKDLTGQDIAHNPWADNFQPGASGRSGSSAASTPATPAKPAKPAATPAKPAATPAKPAAAPAKPAPQQTALKPKYTAADITAWAKSHGKDAADALKRAKKNGLI